VASRRTIRLFAVGSDAIHCVDVHAVSARATADLVGFTVARDDRVATIAGVDEVRAAAKVHSIVAGTGLDAFGAASAVNGCRARSPCLRRLRRRRGLRQRRRRRLGY